MHYHWQERCGIKLQPTIQRKSSPFQYNGDLDVREKSAEQRGLSNMHAEEREAARHTNVDLVMECW